MEQTQQNYGGQSWLWLALWFAIISIGGGILAAMGVPFIIILILIVTITNSSADSASGVGIFTVALLTTIIFSGLSAIAIIVVVAAVAAVGVIVAVILMRKPSILWLVLTSILLLAIIVVFAFPKLNADLINAQFAIGLLIGLLLLPLVNVPFDFFSIALTRTLLRKSRDQTKLLWRLGYSALDIVCALLFMVLLAIVMVVCLQIFDNLLGKDAINVHAVLQSIADDPSSSEHFWIYFALFSTLLPTMFHAVIGVSSMVTFRIGRSWALVKLEQDSDTVRYLLASMLTAQFFASIVLVVLGGWCLFWLFGSVLGFSGSFTSLLLDVQTWTAGFAK